jgi:hypothetical protein
MNSRTSTQRANRFALVAGLLVLIVIGVLYRSNDSLITHAQGDGKITHSASGNTEIWRIDQPNVRQHITEYRQIVFKPGDHVRIDANGCVQTGGFGNTWKRYANPSGPNADHLYHGLIWIPGVIGGRAATGVPPDPKRIVAFLGPGQTVTVPPNADIKQLYLRLGYEDDDYSDDGYNDHDDGTQNQCKTSGTLYGGPAYVVITIVHGPPTQTTTGSPLPFDLVWSSEDDNGIPLDAQWGWQITHPGAFPDPNQCAQGPFSGQCTSWSDIITTDTAEICQAEAEEPFKDNSPPLYGVPGHENWAAGTYVGKLEWESHSTPGTDDDYNFKLFTADCAGLVSVRDNIEVEFDSDETVDHKVFNSIPFWKKLHDTVDHNADSVVNSSLFVESNGTPGLYAIVTGLEGLEMCHSGSNELHPAWAMAIRVKDDNPADEVWAMFVRRWGDEGFCSGDQHILTDLPNNTYTFRLPWRPGATAVKAVPGTNFLQRFSGVTGPLLQSATNQGLLVSFTGLTLPPNDPQSSGNVVVGELHLQWQGGQGPAPLPRTDCFHRNFARSVARSTPEEPEKFLEELLARMAPVQRGQFTALSPRSLAANEPVPQPLRAASAATVIPTLPKRAARARRRQYQSVPDLAKRQRNQRLLDALRKSGGNRTVR